MFIREDVATNQKAKNYGKIVEQRMGHYGNLEQALNAYKAARIVEAVQLAEIIKEGTND